MLTSRQISVANKAPPLTEIARLLVLDQPGRHR
jgi:hypothetical protein